MAVRISSRGRSLRRRGQFGQVVASLFLGIAIIFAALVLSKNRSSKPSAQVAPVVAEFDTVKVPVPTEMVSAGTKVKDIRFKTVSFPKHQLPQGTLLSLDTIAEGVAIASLPANLPLFNSNFSLTAHISNPVIEQIPPGMRAITIRVDATSAVEGWAGSGTVVDVLLVQKEKTSVIAERVKILSAERSVSPVEGAAAPNVPSTVTLLVTQDQCLAINTAIPLGKIAFALRSTRDEESWSDRSYTAQNLKGGETSLKREGNVSGYISVKGEGDTTAYALADGKWIKAEAVPDGFLVASR